MNIKNYDRINNKNNKTVHVQEGQNLKKVSWITDTGPNTELWVGWEGGGAKN